MVVHVGMKEGEKICSFVTETLPGSLSSCGHREEPERKLAMQMEIARLEAMGKPHGEAVIRTYLREGMSSEWKHTRDCQTLVLSIGFTCPEGDSFLLDLASEP